VVEFSAGWTYFWKEREVKNLSSLQRTDGVGPGLDLVLDRFVLVGRESDALSGEGDVVVATGPQGSSRSTGRCDTPDGSWHLS